MAEERDFERTEPASQRRRDDARTEGHVPRSREVETCLLLLAVAAGFWVLGGKLSQDLSLFLASQLTFQRAQAFDPEALLQHIVTDLSGVLFAFAPLAIWVVLVALASPLLIGGWLFTAKSVTPDFSRLDPVRGLGRIFSVQAAAELTKAAGKAIVVGSVALIIVWHQKDLLITLSLEPLKVAAAHVAEVLLTSFLAMVGALCVVAVLDAPFQLWHYGRSLRMSREEVRQETKEMEGDPQIKARIRAQQREVARRRMMSEVPHADVVVTNPQHFAVALRYAEGEMRAPRVVAKGVDELATRIREVAAENNVPLLESPPLARALYRHTALGDEIPEALYTAVAEVLAYVFQLRAYKHDGRPYPAAPTDLVVPPHLDPNNEAATRGLNPGSDS
jgi:flagellar biosynthetic protein FlhB